MCPGRSDFLFDVPSRHELSARLMRMAYRNGKAGWRAAFSKSAKSGPSWAHSHRGRKRRSRRQRPNSLALVGQGQPQPQTFSLDCERRFPLLDIAPDKVYAILERPTCVPGSEHEIDAKGFRSASPSIWAKMPAGRQPSVGQDPPRTLLSDGSYAAKHAALPHIGRFLWPRCR